MFLFFWVKSRLGSTIYLLLTPPPDEGEEPRFWLPPLLLPPPPPPDDLSCLGLTEGLEGGLLGFWCVGEGFDFGFSYEGEEFLGLSYDGDVAGFS